MTFSAIICEFNPLHLGHTYLIQQAKEQSGNPILCLMSGNFVQRGEPAILDKYTRAELAYANGADAVLELPTIFATASAEYFALGAVKLLTDLQCVSHLYFGVESNHPTQLLETFKKVLAHNELETTLQTFLQKGYAYKSAYRQTLETLFGKEVAKELTMPNNILAFLYVKAIHTLKSSIEPVAVCRQGQTYNSTELNIGYASATAIRENIHNHEAIKPYIPHQTYKALQTHILPNKDIFEALILWQLRTIDINDLLNIQGTTEGLPYAIKKYCYQSTTLTDCLNKLKSKRYSYFQLSRYLYHILLNTPQELMTKILNTKQNYAKILCISKKYLPFCRKNKNFYCITKQKDVIKMPPVLQDSYALDCKATNLYSTITQTLANTDTIKGTLFKL